MPHPYAEFEGTHLWASVDAALADLERNGDVAVTTARSHAVGHLCRVLARAGVAVRDSGYAVPVVLGALRCGAVEALGVASVLAGVWLRHDDPRGCRYSRAVQALQLVKLQAPVLTYGVSAGLHLLVYRGGTFHGIIPGVGGAEALDVGAPPRQCVALNVFSLVALLLLLRARPAGAEAGAPPGAA